MTRSAFTKRLIRSGLAVVLVAAAAGPVAAAPAAAPPRSGKIVLAPHRAIYDLTLSKTLGRGIDAVRGRILYDFSGNACDGYALNFRQVSELNSLEGKSTLSDVRSTTWEDGAAKKFRFNSENLIDDMQKSVVDGQAERDKRAVSISLSKPENKTIIAPVNAVFPTEHMRRIIEAALAGRSTLHFPVYDGSETGEKLFNTLTVIGHVISPGSQPPDDAAAHVPALAKLRRWPITVSYFERESKKQEQTGEETPVYTTSFELYENGVSRALVIDNSDIIVTGKMTSIDLKTPKPCK
jgi:hypothetical protein